MTTWTRSDFVRAGNTLRVLLRRDGGNPQYPPTFTGAQARARDSQGADAVGGGSNSTRGTAPASRIRNEPGSGDA